MMPNRMIHRLSIQAMLLLMLLPLIGCIGGAAIVSNQSVSTGFTGKTMPRWVCPSPTPLPTIAKSGPVETPSATGTPAASDWYAPWEQEYGWPPVTPTPYYKDASAFYLGQVIEITDNVYVEPSVTTSVVSGTETLYVVELHWTNQTTGSLGFNPARQLVISTITLPSGRKMAGSWLWTPAASHLAGLPNDASALVSVIPVGSSTTTVPILAPTGSVAVLDVRLDVPGATDTASASGLRVQFSRGEPEPDCPTAGVIGANLTEPRATVIGVAPPPGSDGIVAAALAQVGRQYCWGGKGYTPCNGFGGGSNQVTPACTSYPCFDCSGLTWWAYNEVGITIGHGTANQQNYPVIDIPNATDGDLALFSSINGQGRSGITHVGLLADVNQDGKLDMIHAANYPDGVVIAYDVFRPNSWYLKHLVIITRPPRTSGA